MLRVAEGRIDRIGMDMPNRVLVTGAAGFVGRWVCRTLLANGSAVVALDVNASERRQRENLGALVDEIDLVLVNDLVEIDLRPVLSSVDAVVHLAGSPGVQTSWAGGFDHHVRNNLSATQRLLEAALDAPVDRIVVASSSSVYGNIPGAPATEDHPLRPLSPYGASKAAMEHVVGAYVDRGLAVTPLRYFTVYGPHQRPDMAIHRMIEALKGGEPFPLRGDGSHQRNFTFVGDAAAATVRAIDLDLTPGRPYNVGGEGTASVKQVLDLLGELAGRPVPVQQVAAVPGDPQRTVADITRAREELRWVPEVDLEPGLLAQLNWQLRRSNPIPTKPMPSSVPSHGH
ncbi:MAG: UDP-glucuronate 4-epimerase [Acidimicrobiales bacterium]